MKRVIVNFLFLFGIIGMTMAQTPEAMNYQAVARNASGELLVNQALDLRIGIYSGPGGAVLSYEETHALTSSANGMLNLKIGEGTPTAGTFSAINWSGDEHHIKVEIDAGSGYEDLGTTAFAAVPYSLHAKSAAGWKQSFSNVHYDAGRVGVGTSTPSAGLDIHSDQGYGSAVSLNNTGGGIDWRLVSWTDGTFRLVKSTGSTFSPIVVEPTDGRVGIGTSLPDQQLSVYSNTGISYIRVSDNTTGVTSGLRMGLSGSGNAYIINDETAKSLNIGTDGTTQMKITSDGHIGVNTLSPGIMFHIKQDEANLAFRIEHNASSDYWSSGVGVTTKNYKFYYNNLFRADISSTDGAYTQSSDARLKKDIEYMDAVLPKVKLLKPATYHYIDNAKTAPRSTGFIAQDVEPIFPDVVRTTDDGYKGIVYDGFAVISIKAIQELNQMVEDLQAQVDELKTQINNK